MHTILFTSAIALTILSAAPVRAGEHFPDFPVNVKMTAAAKVGSTVYAGLGTAGQAWYALNLAQAGGQWQALAPFPDQPRDNANAVAIGTDVYVFNGQGKAHPADNQLVMFDTVWKYQTATNTWSKVLTRSPMGGLGAAVATLDGQTILFFGGANKSIFDGYFRDRFPVTSGSAPHDGVSATDSRQINQAEVDERYFNQRPEDYLFTQQVLRYNPAQNQWRNLAIDPNPVTIGAAIAVHGHTVTLIGGELKPGLRSPAAKRLEMSGEKIRWTGLAPLAAGAGDAVQEGVAGAFAGYSNGVLLVAGGANFPGAWQQFSAGQLFAHRGLRKTWRADIYAEIHGRWRVVGQLPAPLGYASYVQLDDGVLVVGGELQGGAASKQVFLMKWNGNGVDIIR